MAGENVANPRMRQAAIELKRVHARDPEYGTNPVLLKQSDDRFPARTRGRTSASHAPSCRAISNHCWQSNHSARSQQDLALPWPDVLLPAHVANRATIRSYAI